MSLWIVESPIEMVEGETITYSIEWLGTSSLSSPTATVKFNSQDVTSTVMPSGSHSVSSNIQTLKPITAATAHVRGSYIVTIQCTVDGNTEIRLLEIRVLSTEDKQ